MVAHCGFPWISMQLTIFCMLAISHQKQHLFPFHRLPENFLTCHFHGEQGTTDQTLRKRVNIWFPLASDVQGKRRQALAHSQRHLHLGLFSLLMHLQQLDITFCQSVTGACVHFGSFSLKLWSQPPRASMVCSLMVMVYNALGCCVYCQSMRQWVSTGEVTTKLGVVRFEKEGILKRKWLSLSQRSTFSCVCSKVLSLVPWIVLSPKKVLSFLKQKCMEILLLPLVAKLKQKSACVLLKISCLTFVHVLIWHLLWVHTRVYFALVVGVNLLFTRYNLVNHIGLYSLPYEDICVSQNPKLHNWKVTISP